MSVFFCFVWLFVRGLASFQLLRSAVVKPSPYHVFTHVHRCREIVPRALAAALSSSIIVYNDVSVSFEYHLSII